MVPSECLNTYVKIIFPFSLFLLEQGLLHLCLHNRTPSGMKRNSSLNQDISWIVVRPFSKQHGFNPTKAR